MKIHFTFTVVIEWNPSIAPQIVNEKRSACVCKWRGMKMAVKTPLSVIWTLPPRRRGRTALFTAAAVAVVMSSLNVSNAVDNDVDLHFFCDKAVRHKYCGGGGGHREWVHSYHVSVIHNYLV